VGQFICGGFTKFLLEAGFQLIRIPHSSSTRYGGDENDACKSTLICGLEYAPRGSAVKSSRKDVPPNRVNRMIANKRYDN
jgi:hypothetical protein